METKNCKLCKEDKSIGDYRESYYDNCLICSKKIKDSLVLLTGHVSEETAKIVDDYPYGFSRRTKIRYWIETTKRGDRFVRQTLNPTTQKWNKPKKDTYKAVMALSEDFRGHINRCTMFWFNIKKETLKQSLIKYKDYPFNELQKSRILEIKAYTIAMEGVTYSCKAIEYRHKVTGEIVTSVNIMEMGDYERVTPDTLKNKTKIIPIGKEA